MCGIAGLINKDATPVDAGLLARMAAAIAHRGPDEEGAYADGPVGFHHKRLAIIDLKTGRQPMTAGPATIVLNGEIYNYRELRTSLKNAGHTFVTESDTEVLLHMYLEHGPDCVKSLNGIFAFLIHDRRNRRIMAARDHFGVKRLYFYENGRRLMFASEIKALLAHPETPAVPQRNAIQEYLVFQYLLNSETFFKDIHRIEPGHYMLFDLDTFARRDVRYWDPDFSVDTSHTEEYFTERLRALLEDAIGLQVRSDVPIGTTLSGGLDSSIVTLFAARRLPAGLKAFTGAFAEGPEFDERPYAAQAAAAAGADLVEVLPTAAEFIETLPRLVEAMDEPMAGPGLFPQYMVARRAARSVKVLLGGQGGDEIFGGYARYVIAYLEQALKGAISETNDEGEHIVSLRSILPNLPALRRYTPLMQRFMESGLFEPMDLRYFRLIDRSGGSRRHLTPEFRASFDDERILGRFRQVFNHPATKSYYNKMVHFDLVANLPALLHVEDRVTMAHGIESRVPLLDSRIVELVASMPPRMKFRGAEMKYILKRAVRDVVPPPILARRDKMGFPVPLHLWARDGVRQYFRDMLLSKPCRERGLFDPAGVEALIECEDAFGRTLWGMINIELWFRTFIDGRPKGTA